MLGHGLFGEALLATPKPGLANEHDNRMIRPTGVASNALHARAIGRHNLLGSRRSTESGELLSVQLFQCGELPNHLWGADGLVRESARRKCDHYRISGCLGAADDDPSASDGVFHSKDRIQGVRAARLDIAGSHAFSSGASTVGFFSGSSDPDRVDARMP